MPWWHASQFIKSAHRGLQCNLVIPCKCDWALNFSEGLATVVLDGVSFYIDKNGKEYIISE